MPPKLAMSTQPGTIRWGIPICPGASSRSGPASNTPPQTVSAHSVVVMSSTASTSPSRTRLSIVRPPVPVAWKTSTS